MRFFIARIKVADWTMPILPLSASIAQLADFAPMLQYVPCGVRILFYRFCGFQRFCGRQPLEENDDEFRH